MEETKHRRVFDQWLADHKGAIFKVIHAYAFTEMDREDLFQEITIQIWKSVPKFKKKSSELTWIYRIALNTALKWKSREKGKHQTESLENATVLQEVGNQIDERLFWLYAEINKLNEIERSLALLILDGFSYKEMANMLGISESNVGVKINRIKKKLIDESKKQTSWNSRK